MAEAADFLGSLPEPPISDQADLVRRDRDSALSPSIEGDGRRMRQGVSSLGLGQKFNYPISARKSGYGLSHAVGTLLKNSVDNKAGGCGGGL
jgi:hypothetical protein